VGFNSAFKGLVGSQYLNNTVIFFCLVNLIREERKILKSYMNIIEIYNTFKINCPMIKRRTQFCQCATRTVMHSCVILFFCSNMLSSWF